MSFGISGQDPFKAYSSNAEAGGGMGAYRKIRKGSGKDKKDSKEETKLLNTDFEDDDDNYELDMDDFNL